MKMTRDQRQALAVGRHACPSCAEPAGFRCLKRGTYGIGMIRLKHCHKARLDLVGNMEEGRK